MAAMMGPDMMVGSTTNAFDHSTTASDITNKTPRSQIPLPNPPFVFPAKPASSAPLYSRATGRRPHSAIEPQLPSFSLGADIEKPVSRSPALPALPAFSFNPGNPLPPAALTESSFLSPTLPPSAPSSPRAIPTRPGGHGHRRGGSEFVGGSIRGGDPITVNLGSSPTKSESGLASPLLQPKKSAGRRGHAHRRSAAISSHDLSSIILPPTAREVKKDSPPASPATVDPPKELPLVSDEKSQTETTTTAIAVSEVPEILALEPEVSTPPAEEPVPTAEVQEPPKPVVRTRVGFSDTLEYIPRPVSLVSSETSSTITARPGHSVSGSISSVISITNVELGLNTPLAFHSSPEINDRPSTAGAVLERTETVQEQVQEVVSSRRRGSIPLLGSIPPPSAYTSATPSPTKASKKWSFFGKDTSTSSPTRCSESPKLSASAKSTPQRSPALPAQQLPEELAEMKPLTKKRSKKKKKVKTWAGSILSRKQSKKSRNGKGLRRTPTPTSRRSYSVNEPADMVVEPEAVMPTVLVTEEVDPTAKDWDSYKPASLPDEETSYQMIDLDAALGPFNTPLPRNPEWEAAQRAGGTVKKQLHSAAGLRGFTGPGMHYHRRAESAPELVPFEGGRFGFPRFGSSSTMADVFEEDEEEDEDESPKSTGQSTPVMEIPLAETFEELKASAKGKDVAKPTADEQRDTATESVAVPSGVNTDEDGNASVKSSIHAGSLASQSEDALQQETSVTDSPRPSFSGYQNELQARHSFSESATPSPRQTSRPRDLAAVDCSPLTLPAATSCAPVSPHSMTPSSAFPSPRSPLSYDAHRISTAPSSITEDNFQSLLMGEPGPEVRISVDDVPSLTSGDSSMTRESFFAQNPQARQLSSNTLPRPASFSASAFGRRRSSLASLSRLVSSSHGERSKLSMEVSANDDGSEKKVKPSKTKRLGRFVQFWKSKENSEA
ncbi:hypothetical protein QBC45DRAFT_76832 [Copromyces sp. CBS 386.78]|nr:hypothetical protein QBC45DRAFT_76832 [Copromyces sp. CBS 386.78]